MEAIHEDGSQLLSLNKIILLTVVYGSLVLADNRFNHEVGIREQYIGLLFVKAFR